MALTQDEIVNQFGLSSLSPDKQTEMLNTIMETVELRVGMKLADKLTEEQTKSLSDLTSQGKNAEAVDWLAQLNPDYEQLIKDELAQLKNETDDAVRGMLDKNE